MFPGAMGLFRTADQDSLLNQSCLMAEDSGVSWGHGVVSQCGSGQFTESVLSDAEDSDVSWGLGVDLHCGSGQFTESVLSGG